MRRKQASEIKFNLKSLCRPKETSIKMKTQSAQREEIFAKGSFPKYKRNGNNPVAKTG